MPTPADARARADRQARRAVELRLLSRELERLRKAGGFTPDRLSRETFLVQLLGGGDEPFELLRERFISAIRSLRDPEPALLMAIYGLSDDTKDSPGLTARREIYGKTIDRKAPTVADLEPAALAHLRVQLLTGWYPQSPVGTFVSPAHNGAAFESVLIELVFRNKRWMGTREHWRMLALFDEADYLAYSASHPGVPASLTDDFTVRSVNTSGGVSHQFWHREPRERGQVYDLEFFVEPVRGDDVADAVTETSRAFHEPTRAVRMQLTFLGDKPTTIWFYERLSYFERPGRPDTKNRLPFHGDVVRADFQDLQGGLFNGVAWEW